jgi:hypothetical protein
MDDLAEISSRYYAGMQTCRDGLPFDTEASDAWKKGWQDCERDRKRPASAIEETSGK